MPSKINPWVVMAIFTVLVGPFALSFHMHYPDEMYYSNAAVRMLQNGDFLTTYLGSGELRFKKPILTYWAVLSGFKIFGVNAFASRIFFLLAGTATVGLTYLLAKTLFANRKIAGLSALIMASNPILIFSATRSIPDVLLVLSMTAAAIGFAGLIKYGNAVSKKYLWILYLSLALAFEVKGLPAIALGGLGILILLINPWQQIRWKTLLYLPAIIVSVLVAIFWFAAMWNMYGPTFLDGFLYDQVGTRVTSKSLLILQNGLLAFFLLNIMFFPWIFFGLRKPQQTLQKMWQENRTFFVFALIWALAIVGMGALTSKFYERYLLPVAPVIAVWIAWFLVQAKFELQKFSLRIVLGFFLLVNLIVLGFSLWLNWRMQFSGWIWLQLFLGILIFGYLVRLFVLHSKLAKGISYSVLLLFFLASTVTYRISLPDQGQQFQQNLSKIPTSKEPIAFMGNLHVSSKIRVGLGSEYEVVDLPKEGWESKLEEFPNLIIEDQAIHLIDSSAYQLVTQTVNWDSKAIPKLLMAAGSPEFDRILNTHKKSYFLLRKK